MPPIEPFVGRARELAQLRAWAETAGDTGIGRFVLVTGEAGTGKSRLCAELARQLASEEISVAWSRCWTGGAGPPLWPWTDVVAELAGPHGQAPAIPPDRPHDRFELFHSVGEQLRSLCADRPSVALIDDLHAASRDAQLLATFIARSLHRFPLLVIAAWRIERPTTVDAAPALDAIAREADVIELRPFGPVEVAAYLRCHDRGAPTDGEVADLHAASGGNPMYLAELVRHAPRGGSGGDLAHALARRVASLGPELRRILGIVALLGDGATVVETAAVLGERPDDVTAAVEDVASGAAIVDGEIRFSHELLRAAFLDAVPVATRATRHASAHDVIAGGHVDDAVRRAHHAVAAAALSGDRRAIAVQACATAATALQSALAFEQAAEWAAQGAELAADPAAPDAHAAAVLAHAGAVLAAGRLGEARQLYERAVALAERAEAPVLLASAALGLGGMWVEEQRDEVARRRMLGLCRRALDALPEDEPVLAALLAVRLAAEHAYHGAAIDDVGAAVDVVRRLGDPVATAAALSLYHHTLLVPDRAEDRLAVADELLDVAAPAAAADIFSLFGLCWRTVDLYLLGHPDAERAFRQLREQAMARGSNSVSYIVAVLDVMRTFRRGELAQAESAAAETLALGEAAGDLDALGYYGAHLLAIRWAQGRLAEMLAPITTVMESSTLRRRDLTYPALYAYALAVRGERAAARSALDGLLADGVDAIPDFSTSTTTMTVLIETAAVLDDAELAAALSERFAPYAHLPVMPSLAVVCLGPGERVMGVAQAAAGQLDAAVDSFRAALDANRRLGNRPFDALITAELAATLVRRDRAGDRTEASEHFATAIELGRVLGLDARVVGWEAAAEITGAHRGDVPAQRGRLERRDGYWHVEIGGRAAQVKHVVGMRHVAELVARPDTDIPARELSAAVTGVPVPGDRGEAALDWRARDEYRQRLLELDRELDSADVTGDAERGRRAAQERAALVVSLRRDVGLRGRPRRIGDDAERCRMRVTKAIHRALSRLSDVEPALGRALSTRIQTGHTCRYSSDPGQPITWHVQPSSPR